MKWQNTGLNSAIYLELAHFLRSTDVYFQKVHQTCIYKVVQGLV